ncbi:MAG TPA: glycosyltransferase family 4 protein, partial [Saliniramus sp.]|nr:glycosyltransferase family 4 protein [Saliniramus sp.]
MGDREAVVAYFAIPGDLASPTGGYAYARKILPLFEEYAVAITHLPLPGSFPYPTDEDIEAARTALAATPEGAILLIDGLALGALPPDLVKGLGRRVVALVHHPLGLETGLDEERRDALLRNEALVLSHCERVVVTSPLTAEVLTEAFGVSPAVISIAEPGTDPAPPAEGSLEGEPLSILAVGAVSPRKGYALLVEALSELKHRPWHLTIAGASDRDPKALEDLRAAIALQELDERVTLAGAVSEERLDELYRSADIFVSASLFEGYGVVLAEAMARGLPMVVSPGGAAAQTVPDEAAIKVPPGDAYRLRAALSRVIADPNERSRLAHASLEAGRSLPRWNEA